MWGTGLTSVSFDALCCVHLVLERSFWEMFEHWFRGSLHEYACVQGELLWFVALVVLLFVYRWCGALLPPCEESVRALLSSDLVFVLCLAFDHLLSLCLFLCCFFFLFHIVTVCVVNALIKGEIEDQEHPRARVVAP